MKSASLFLIFAAFSHADTLVDWNFASVAAPTANNTAFTGFSNSNAAVATHLTVTNLISGTAGGGSDSGGGIVGSNGNPTTGELNLQRWDYNGTNTTTTGNGDGTPNNWIQCNVNVAFGYQFTLTSIDLSAWRNGAGAPANWRFDYSSDGGTTWTPFSTAQAETNVGLVSGSPVFRPHTFTGAVTASSLVIRYVAFGPVGGTGNLHINDLVFNGTIALNAYGLWVQGFGLDLQTDGAPGEDPDHDGKSNALEFATNDNPVSGTESGKLVCSVQNVGGEDVLTYTLPVRGSGTVFTGATQQVSKPVDGFIYHIQGSNNLTDFTTMVISEVTPALDAGLPALDAGWEYRTLRAPGGIAGGPRTFIRAMVETTN